MYKYYIIFLGLLFFTSCGNIKNIEVEELQYVDLKTLKGSKAVVEIGVLINNPSSHNIRIKDADIEILRDGYSFGTADLYEQSVINKHSRDTVKLKFNLNISDKMAIMSGRIKAILAGEDRTTLSFSGYIKGGTKMVSKKIKFENLEFEEEE